MQKKYIKYDNTSIYAIYYRETKVIYYNLNFQGITEIIILV